MQPNSQRAIPGIAGMSDENREQLGKLLQIGIDALKPKHEPILSSLKKIGIKPQIRALSSQRCLVIPLTELMEKEYLFMSGIDMDSLVEEEVVND